MKDFSDRFTANGGAIRFYDITMKNKDRKHPQFYKLKMGSEAGVVEWYEHKEGKWSPYDINTKKSIKKPLRHGTVY
ncbi:hypothetical protein K4L44_04200 [Halosquirtibacter laminarini]|uniref:Uncharacterized protein n=1 Tax=Halosquirtibacter laminarini TaxID=3374600 RepID=A0AC61NHC5_9BACT|nr:hypothetical protein K4L44_04200 [Prolixibacteraceae bacterium]